MEQSVNTVEFVTTLLDSGKYKEAIDVPNDQNHAENFKENCCDLVSVIIGKIQDDTIIIKPSLYGVCEKLLTLITEKSAPENALLEFIEQIELAKNDAQFSIILTPLQHVLIKLSTKRDISVEWCLNSISTYIESIPKPNLPLEGKERLLLDCDANVRRITRIYSVLPPFYTPIIQAFSDANTNIRSKQIIASFLISLLGKPLIYIDLDPESNAKNEARQSCATIIQDICKIEKNVLKFLVNIESCYKQNQKSKISAAACNDDEEKSPYEHREKINMTTLSGLFYVVFSGHFELPDSAIPQIYSPEYLVNVVMLCVVHLLSFTDYGPLVKGISLFKVILGRLSNKMSHVLLTSSVHYEVCKGLVNAAIYSSFESVRKDAVNLIGCHINKFDYKGKCLLIKYLMDTANHSGMIGYAITLYKNAINEAFKDSVLSECFSGVQLMSMVKKICYLPHGAQSDLVELADQIITALNFLRYLAIKDTQNLSGIRQCFSIIETDYLKNLRTGLNMSKAHYEEKLKEIEETKNLPEDIVNVSVNVCGNILDKIPTENKKEIIHSALNAFHLIEGLIARLSECIIMNQSAKSYVL